MDCSVIIPVYYNEGSLLRTFSLVKEELEKFQLVTKYEIIFIDDGSMDGSYDEMKKIYSSDPSHVKLVKLTRNFGQVSAMKAGYQLAKGRCIINISAE